MTSFPHLRRLDNREKSEVKLHSLMEVDTSVAPVLHVHSNVSTSAGQPTTLVCEVSGTPAPTIKWSHDGKAPINLEDKRYLILADHSLFIQDTSLEVCPYHPSLIPPSLSPYHPSPLFAG